MSGKKQDDNLKFAYWVPIVIILLGMAARVRFLFHESLWPDEALYMQMAENLVSNLFDLTDCCGNPYYANPPFFMYLLSLLFRVTDHASSLAMARLIPLSAGAGTIAVTYIIGKKLFGKTVGIVSALLLAFNPLHLWISTRVLSDVPMTFLLYFAILMLMVEKRKMFYLFSILGVATKYHAAPALFLAPVKTILEKKPRLAVWTFLFCVFSMVVYLLFRKYIHIENPVLAMIIFKFRTPDLQEIIRETNFFLGPVVLAFFVGGFAIAVKKRRFSYVLVWIILFGTARLFLPWVAFRVSRYTLPLYPGILVFSAYGAIQCVLFLKEKFPQRTLIITVIAISIGIYTGVTHLNNGFAVTRYNNDTFLGFDEAGAFLSKQGGNGLSILTSSPCQIRYYTEGFTVIDLPEKAEIDDVKRMIAEKDIDYVSLDVWSPHQPKWSKTYFSPQNGFLPVFKNKYVIIFELAKPGKK